MTKQCFLPNNIFLRKNNLIFLFVLCITKAGKKWLSNLHAAHAVSLKDKLNAKRITLKNNPFNSSLLFNTQRMQTLATLFFHQPQKTP